MGKPIQTIPQGLLGLLQLKQTGANPSDLLETVQPTVDLTNWWLQRQEVDIALVQSGFTNPVVINAAGIGVFGLAALTVPGNDTWLVTNLTILASLLATEDLVVSGGFTFPGSGSAVYELGPALVEPTDSTARARQVTWSARGFWLQPGARPQVIVHDIKTAASISVVMGIRGVIVPI